jgi:hypothetical protein
MRLMQVQTRNNLGKQSNIDFSSIGESIAEVFDSVENSACTLVAHPHQVRQMPANMLAQFPVLDTRE